ncbi:oxygenase MpaB family protein [Alloalcanivorax mobilis]|uniref:oxygenase MpaB family protein n=1 Tax=Alloalcanivorax mobilis TaxID=2019569 RepID=UPI000C778994|nr:oxygenase MpaB family protein [Alloalcanivorax mobilis]
MTASAPVHAIDPPAAPARVRPFAKTQAATPAWKRRLLGRPLAPSRQEYHAVVGALSEGDREMDALVAWMYDYGLGEARALFEQALNNGLDSLEAPPEPLRRFFAGVEQAPAWLDPALLEQGARFIHGTGRAAHFVLRDLALMGGYLLSGFNQSLVMTGALSKGTARRVAETGQWWIDCTEPGGLTRFGPGFRSSLHVRLVHALVRRNLAARSEWNSDTWGLPLSQIDMAATYLGFSVVMLGGLRMLGIPISGGESRAVMHLWSYACWLMGVDSRWLRFSEREGMVLLHHTLMTQSRPDWTSRELGQALAEEPMARHYRVLRSVRRRYARHVHLSVTRYFIGREKMGQLGLSQRVLPWYPLAGLVPRLIGYGVPRFVPGLRGWQQRRGRRAQLATLASMFGDQERGLTKGDG